MTAEKEKAAPFGDWAAADETDVPDMNIDSDYKKLSINAADWIDFFTEQGLSLIPLRRNEKRPPRGQGWKKYTQERMGIDELKRKLNEEQSENYGVICGEISNNLLVIDVDNAELFERLKLYELSEKTLTIKTAKGYHFYLLIKKEHIKQLNEFIGDKGVRTLYYPPKEQGKDNAKEEIRFQWEDHYVVGVGSIHPSGIKYEHYNKSPKVLATPKGTGFLEEIERRWQSYRKLTPITPETLKEPLLDFIRRFVTPENLEDHGDYIQMKCPFHEGTSPNAFTIYKDDNHWYDFSEEIGGRHIEFYMRLKGVTREQAVKELGIKVGKARKGDTEQKDIATLVEEALKEAGTPIYHGAINFEEGFGLFYTVPVNIGGVPPYKQPIFFTPAESFAQPMGDCESCVNMKEAPAHPQQMNGIFAQPYKLFEGVPLFRSEKQRVQILQAYQTLLKTGKIVCKPVQMEIETLPATKTISYFKYTNEIENYLVSCWSIGTYLFPMFPVFPYLIFVGEKGTNKSGNLSFLAKICWNPTNKLSIPNEAPLFRMIHQGQPTLLIDEAHRILNHPLYGPTLQAILEAGHERGGCVPRCDENDRNKILFFDVYTPKALASRETLELEEKAITIVIRKNLDKKYAKARKTLDTDKELDIIQENLFYFALSKWHEIYLTYLAIDPTPRLAGRYFLLWAPLLAICKVAYPERYNELLTYAEESVVGVEKRSYEVEIRVLSLLATQKKRIEKDGNAILLKDITEPLKLKWQPVYSALRNLGLIKADRDTQLGKKYYLHIDKLEQLAKERSIETEDSTEDSTEDITTDICDKCGEQAQLVPYKGSRVCEDCLNQLLEEEQQQDMSDWGVTP